MARMRTIDQAVAYFRKLDPETAINSTMLRRWLKEKKISYVKVGNKFLLDIDKLSDWLSNPTNEISDSKEHLSYERLRKN